MTGGHSADDSVAWWRLASSSSIVRRALRYACGVGALLIVINHGDVIVRRDVSIRRLVQMCLTIAVPYAVSSASSIGAMREFNRRIERQDRTVVASAEKQE